MNKIILTIMIILSATVSSVGQITYEAPIFALDKNPVNYSRPNGFHITGYNGISLIGLGSWLKIDLSNGTCISGSNNTVNLYDAESGMYSTLFVSQIFNHSDERAKVNIKPLGESRISQIHPVSYKWKPVSESTPMPAAYEGIHYGVIAQELSETFPELVKTDDYGNMMVNYIGLIPVLTKSLQEIDARLTDLESELEALLAEKALLEGTESQLNTMTP